MVVRLTLYVTFLILFLDGQNNIFRCVQERLIENDFGNLAEYLNELEPESKHESRFIAHLAIILQQHNIGNMSTNPLK